MTFRDALVSRGMHMGVSIDQMTNDGYFLTQKDHLHLLEGVSKHIWSNTPPTTILGGAGGRQFKIYDARIWTVLVRDLSVMERH